MSRRSLVALVLLVFACAEQAQDPADADDEKLRKLQSLPYTARVPVKEGLQDSSGVVRHDPELAYEGLNLFARSGPTPEALLIDMQGEIVHRWSSAEGQVNAEADVPHRPFYEGWQHVEPADDGASLFAIVEYQTLLKLDRESRLVWKAEVSPHHDLAVAEDGDIYTFGGRVRRVSVEGRSFPLLDNTILVLAPDGRLETEVSLFDLLRSDAKTKPYFDQLVRERLSQLAFMWEKLDQGEIDDRAIWEFQREIFEERFDGAPSVALGVLALTPADVIHVNSIEFLERSLPGTGEAGDLLLSFRELNLVAVVDRALTRVRWSWGAGVLYRQHQPSIVDGGNILVFDNGEKRSRVLQLDPRQERIVWSYAPDNFWSQIRGGCEKLPNGNVLVTDSQNGRAVEVTEDGRVAWEFYNPDLDASRRSRGAIYRMTRLPRGMGP